MKTYISSIFTLVLITLFSCSKEEINDHKPTAKSQENHYELYHSETFNSTGIIHNKNLQYLLDHLPENTNAKNIRKNTEQVLAKQYGRNDLGDLHIFETYESPMQMLEELFAKKMISKNLFIVLQNDYTEISDFADEKNPMESFILSRFNNLEKLSTNEKEAYLNQLSVLKHSFEFWKGRSFSKHFDLNYFNRIAKIAMADAVTHNTISVGTLVIDLPVPMTTFDYVQSSYYGTFNGY